MSPATDDLEERNAINFCAKIDIMLYRSQFHLHFWFGTYENILPGAIVVPKNLIT